MTRNERIAERIRKKWNAEDVCERVHDAFLDGDFSDLIAPAVTAEVAEHLRKHARYLWARARENLEWVRQYPAASDDCFKRAMRLRRLAKFMRELERSAAT